MAERERCALHSAHVKLAFVIVVVFKFTVASALTFQTCERTAHCALPHPCALYSLQPQPACSSINGPPPVGLPLRQKAKGAAALEVWAGVEWGVLAALGA